VLALVDLRAQTLEPVSLTVPDGQCVAIQGASGSGKSLLLRAVADLDPHDGDAEVDGRRCSNMPAPQWRRLVGYVPAESGWWADSVREHFDAGIDLPALLSDLGLNKELAEASVSRLSTGERQRLALLRAMRPGVRALLLDEPTSGLDEASTARVERWLSSALAGGLSVLLVTHSAAQAGRLARRCFTLHDGRLGEQAT
jgi:ABC-type multidrug transport system ATPase subunit